MTEDGEIWTWGGNSHGQLGNGIDPFGLPELPAEVDSLVGIDFKQVACGEKHTLALSADGGVFSWGSDDCGQLGLPEAVAKKRPSFIEEEEEEEEDELLVMRGMPTLIPNLPPCSFVAASKVSAAVGETGRLYIWGTHPTLNPKRSYPKPKPSGGLGSESDTVLGAGWGADAVTERREGLGGGGEGHALSSSSEPLLIHEAAWLRPKRVRTVALGPHHAVVSTCDGCLFTWGELSASLGHPLASSASPSLPSTSIMSSKLFVTDRDVLTAVEEVRVAVAPSLQGGVKPGCLGASIEGISSLPGCGAMLLFQPPKSTAMDSNEDERGSRLVVPLMRSYADRMRALFEQASASVCSVGSDGSFTHQNSRKNKRRVPVASRPSRSSAPLIHVTLHTFNSKIRMTIVEVVENLSLDLTAFLPSSESNEDQDIEGERPYASGAGAQSFASSQSLAPAASRPMAKQGMLSLVADGSSGSRDVLGEVDVDPLTPATEPIFVIAAGESHTICLCSTSRFAAAPGILRRIVTLLLSQVTTHYNQQQAMPLDPLRVHLEGLSRVIAGLPPLSAEADHPTSTLSQSPLRNANAKSPSRRTSTIGVGDVSTPKSPSRGASKGHSRRQSFIGGSISASPFEPIKATEPEGPVYVTTQNIDLISSDGSIGQLNENPQPLIDIELCVLLCRLLGLIDNQTEHTDVISAFYRHVSAKRSKLPPSSVMKRKQEETTASPSKPTSLPPLQNRSDSPSLRPPLSLSPSPSPSRPPLPPSPSNKLSLPPRIHLVDESTMRLQMEQRQQDKQQMRVESIVPDVKGLSCVEFISFLLDIMADRHPGLEDRPEECLRMLCRFHIPLIR